MSAWQFQRTNLHFAAFDPYPRPAGREFRHCYAAPASHSSSVPCFVHFLRPGRAKRSVSALKPQRVNLHFTAFYSYHRPAGKEFRDCYAAPASYIPITPRFIHILALAGLRDPCLFLQLQRANLHFTAFSSSQQISTSPHSTHFLAWRAKSSATVMQLQRAVFLLHCVLLISSPWQG